MAIRVGFVGLGHQGAPIAVRIAGAGYALSVWARRRPTLTALAAMLETAGAPPATEVGSLRELGADNDVVIVCVGDDADCEQVVLGEGDGVLAGMRAGSTLVIHSTLRPSTVVALADRAAERDVALLDAPVSGSRARAEDGTLTVIVGGDPGVIAGLAPLFDSYAGLVATVGPVGSAQLVKLLNNTLNYANMAMAASALELAVDLGMDEALVARILAASSGTSRGLAVITNDELLAKTLEPSAGARKIVPHFAAELAERGMQDPPLLAVAATAYDHLRARATRLHVDAGANDG